MNIKPTITSKWLKKPKFDIGAIIGENFKAWRFALVFIDILADYTNWGSRNTANYICIEFKIPFVISLSVFFTWWNSDF